MKKRDYILGVAVLGGLIVAHKLRKENQNFNVKNRVVIITGGTRGLGLIMARQLSREGARVAICGRDQEELDLAKEELAKITTDYLGIKCDVTQKVEVMQMVQQIRQHWGEVEVLINNAGIIQVGPMENMEEKDFQRSIDVHFWGAYNFIQAVLPGMKKAQQGRIVNIASINAKVSFPHLLPYTVGKHALAGFSEGITSELVSYGIKVTSVYPGLMRTGSPRNIDVKAQHEKEYAWFKISDSLPGISINAERASSKIIKAMQQGDRTLILGWSTKLASFIEGISPGLNLKFFEFANTLLPDSRSSDASEKKGYESETDITKSILTKKTQEAEENNNQLRKP